MTLKEKIEEMIDIMSIISSITSLVLDKTKNYYRIPKNITNWQNILVSASEKETLTVRSKAQPIHLTRAFVTVWCEILDITGVDTSKCLNWDNCFKSLQERNLQEIKGSLDFSSTKRTDITVSGTDMMFGGCNSLNEVRFVENSFNPLNNWFDFTDSPNLSEDTLLSIANSIDPTLLIENDAWGFFMFASSTLENMPQYIKDIFAERRCELE